MNQHAHICLLQIKDAIRACADTVARLIMNTMARQIIAIHSRPIQTENSKKSKQKVTAFILSVIDILILICLYNECVVGLCFIGCLPSSHPLRSHFSNSFKAKVYFLYTTLAQPCKLYHLIV